jgi:hypothetical protein
VRVTWFRSFAVALVPVLDALRHALEPTDHLGLPLVQGPLLRCTPTVATMEGVDGRTRRRPRLGRGVQPGASERGGLAPRGRQRRSTRSQRRSTLRDRSGR